MGVFAVAFVLAGHGPIATADGGGPDARTIKKSLTALVDSAALGLDKLSIHLLLQGRTVKVRFTAPIPGSVAVQLQSGPAETALLSGGAVFPSPGTQTMALKLTKAGKAKFRGSQTVRAALRALFVASTTSGVYEVTHPVTLH